ncbi:MAG TPA: ABC transporter permease, partial [Longimicrobiales bacterium]|nr:ABC transporter permease [Longimicrobiales bacterium]
AQGLSQADALREAERRFGSISDYRRELVMLDRRHAQAVRWSLRAGAAADVVKQAGRSVVRAPMLAAAVVLTLALGLGANVMMYSIIDRLMLSPPEHVREPEHVRRIMIESYSDYLGARSANGTLAWADVLDLEEATVLDGAAVWSERQLTVGHGLDARELDGVAVSGNYFALLGAEPALGRFITPEDDSDTADPVTVIGYELWQREYGGSRDVLGRTLDLGEGAVAIVGVAPPGMTTLRLARADVWLPATQAMGAEMRTARNWYSFGAVARLAEGVNEDAAMDQLTALHLRGRSEQVAEGDYPDNARVLLTPLLEARGPLASGETRVAKWLAGISLIVLLIASVNVANLMLARMVRQSREVAVRLALGISRRRLVMQLLIEGMLLGLGGGAAALLLASYAGTAVSTVLLPTVAWEEIGWSARLVPLALTVAALTGLLAALVPALHASRRDPGLTLRQAGAGGVTRSTARVRTGLALAQAALCVLLLIGAGLFVRSLDAVRSVQLGLELDDVLYVETRLRPGTTTEEERSAVSHAVVDRLRAHPRIEAAAGAFTAPFMGSLTSAIRLPGRDSVPRVGGGTIWMHIVSSDYFRLLAIPLVRGRAFEARDATGDARVLIVNETMARALWPTADPLGQCVYPGAETECSRVIGVARDAKQRQIREEPSMQYYVPLDRGSAARVIMARARPASGDGAEMLRAAVLSVDPRIRHVRITQALDRLAPQEREWRLGATMFSAFGMLALVVAGVGLYAVLAFDTSQRTREIGI